jgi:3-dehydroquinate dehydratase-2
MILLVNGPNLNLLGEREPETYGYETLADVERMVSETCAGYGLPVKAFQSNWEGALLDFLQEHRHEAQGVILNPGALAQTSRVLAECVRSLRCPTIEVHISNVHAREAWRRESLVAPCAQGQIAGLGIAGYYYAAVHLCTQIAAQAATRADDAPASAFGEPPASPAYGETTPAGGGREDAPASELREVAPAFEYRKAAPSTGYHDATATGYQERAPAGPATAAPAPAGAGAFDIGDLLPEPSQQVPVDQMPRGDYEPL